jgi:hypothetical protein
MNTKRKKSAPDPELESTSTQGVDEPFTIHPVALKFPSLPEEERAELKESIRKFGQFDPIIVDPDTNQILDGRNRLEICQELGVKPKIARFDHLKDRVSPEEYIFDVNMKRRHLTTSQRAAIAAEFANMRQGTRTDLEPSDNCPEVSLEKASELLKVSRKSVSRAKKVKEEDPDTFAKVKSGGVSLNSAVNSVETNRAEQSQQRQKKLRSVPKYDHRKLEKDWSKFWSKFLARYQQGSWAEIRRFAQDAILAEMEERPS